MNITKAMFVDLIMRSKVMVAETRTEYSRAGLSYTVKNLLETLHTGKARTYTPRKLSNDRIQLNGKTQGDLEVIFMDNYPQAQRVYYLYPCFDRLILQQTTNYLDGEVKSTLHRYFILL